jgi:ribosome-associated toxin RatA of RatAB toxin-antitoxin module
MSSKMIFKKLLGVFSFVPVNQLAVKLQFMLLVNFTLKIIPRAFYW